MIFLFKRDLQFQFLIDISQKAVCIYGGLNYTSTVKLHVLIVKINYYGLVKTNTCIFYL